MDDRNRLKQEFKIRLYKYVLSLLRFLTRLPNEPVVREIKSQTTRSGTSMGANYFEAQGASSKKDYQNYFAIALKSSNETAFWLAILRDSGLAASLPKEECERLLRETKEIANIFASSIITMKGKG